MKNKKGGNMRLAYKLAKGSSNTFPSVIIRIIYGLHGQNPRLTIGQFVVETDHINHIRPCNLAALASCRPYIVVRSHHRFPSGFRERSILAGFGSRRVLRSLASGRITLKRHHPLGVVDFSHTMSHDLTNE